MVDTPRLSRQQAIDELRREALELEQKPCSLREYARNAYKASIRRRLADRLEQGQDLTAAGEAEQLT